MAYEIDRPPIDQGVSSNCKPKTRPLQFKRGTSRAWRKANPVLLSGEPGFEVNTYKMKVGDGRSRWSELPYIGDHSAPKDGKSAYEIWLDAGHSGTIDDFLQSLIGEPGKSTYEIWLSLGHEGTVQDFIDDIKGEKGDKGDPGKSAYEIWLELGHTGTEEDFIASLKGEKGDSAYQVWIDAGHTGTVEDFFLYIKGDKGDKGDTGMSAYEVWIDAGHTGTVDDYLAWLQWESLYHTWADERAAQGLPNDLDTYLRSLVDAYWEKF